MGIPTALSSMVSRLIAVLGSPIPAGSNSVRRTVRGVVPRRPDSHSVYFLGAVDSARLYDLRLQCSLTILRLRGNPGAPTPWFQKVLQMDTRDKPQPKGTGLFAF